MTKSLELATLPKYDWLSLSLETFLRKNDEKLSSLQALISRIRQLSLDLHKRVTAIAQVNFFHPPPSDCDDRSVPDTSVPSCKASKQVNKE
jgi:hypothetical protein